MSFQAYRTGNRDDFLLSGRRLYQHSITNSAKHSGKTYHRAGQRFFWVLARTKLLWYVAKIIPAEMWLQNYHRLFSVSYILEWERKRRRSHICTSSLYCQTAGLCTQCDG